ncbi:MAG: PbpA [Desulfamplus sp.]|nr:PbpA [Desulfamplus sp.]
MYRYSHNHSDKTSWRTFQKNLQREAKQNTRQNSRVLKKPMQSNTPSFTMRKSLSLKNIDRSQGRLPLKKIVVSLAIIIAVAFVMQQIVPVFISGAQNFFTEATAFFKHDAASFFKELASTQPKSHKKTENIKSPQKKATTYLSKKDLRTILEPQKLLNLKESLITINDVNRKLNIATSLDMRLQNFLLDQLDSLALLNRGKPEVIAMVVMEPHTGRILAMAGFDSHSPDINPCTEVEYPAASLFKMVTASAAVETHGYSPATTMYFSGGKYTLYKRQLQEETNSKFTNKVTLAEAFAQSINPVFGKLGSLILGKDVLEKYASSFGFNQEIDSEINFKPGSFTITESAYQWAEVACGFNKTTTISPVFGAMIASTMLNSGKTPVPSIVESVTDGKGMVLYKRKSETLNDTVKPDTAKALMQMMNGTVITGTARKSFRGVDKDNVLSKLNIGGKTGSLSNYDKTIRFDWFSGFCSDNKEQEQIVVSVLVGHGKYIGTKASIYGRLIFKEYFDNYFALNSKPSTNS